MKPTILRRFVGPDGDIDIILDGSAGEGGGQILRTALSLSAVTGRPFAIERVRANRLKAGLRPQHKAAAEAMARLCDAEVSGAEVGSSRVHFAPRKKVEAGEHAFDIGTAGSTPLLFQTLCWPLALAGGPSHLTLKGGTHLQQSPTFHYLALVWAPAVARLGATFECTLSKAGFYPEGGGEMTARVHPAHAMPPLDIRNRGMLRDVEVVSMVGGLPYEIADRQAKRARARLRDLGVASEVDCVPVPCERSQGSHLIVVGHFEKGRAGYGANGEKGKSAEKVADEATSAFGEFLRGSAAVDEHLGDQLLLPAALSAAGLLKQPAGVVPVVRYTVHRVTKHLTTNADVVKRFLDVEIAVFGREGEEGEVRVEPPGAGVEVTPLRRES